MRRRLLLADYHTMIRQGLCRLLSAQPEIEVVGEAETGYQAVDLCRKLKPDVAVMDAYIPEPDSLEVTRRIKKDNEKVKIIGLSMHVEKRRVMDLLMAGASAYIMSNNDFGELLEAIETVCMGGLHLSPAVASLVIEEIQRPQPQEYDSAWELLTRRERQVVEMMLDAKTVKEIAGSLALSPNTVYVHRRNLMEKLNVRNTADLTKNAIRHGIANV